MVVRQTLVTSSRRTALLAGAVLLILTAGSGCVSSWGTLANFGDCPPTGTPCQVVATWHHDIVTAPDPAHGGVGIPGLAGRLYLFGPQIDFPMVADGALSVDLYNETNLQPGQPGVLMNQWNIDPVSLKKLLKKDAIGWGYTVFLPWKEYRPDITRVRLKARFIPSQSGTLPLYAPDAPLTVNSDAPVPTVTRTASKPKS